MRNTLSIVLGLASAGLLETGLSTPESNGTGLVLLGLFVLVIAGIIFGWPKNARR